MKNETQVATVEAPASDFKISNHGSICLFHPLTPAAEAWLDEHCPADADHHYWGGGLVVEPRYLRSIIDNAINDGLNY